MKIIAYTEAGKIALGLVTSPTHFLAVADIAPDLPTSLIAILEQEDGLARLQQAAHGRQGDRALADFTLKPFLDRPNAMWALALNFKSHIAETGLKTSSEFPHLFMRTAASYVGGRFQASCRLDG